MRPHPPHLALILTLLSSGIVAASPPGLAVEPTGPATAVLGGEHGTCGAEDIPDQPLRAFRRDDGSVVALATHWRVRRLVGPNLNALRRDCAVAFEARGASDPAAHSDRSWVSAVWTPDGRTVHALLHDEYQAHRHPGACALNTYAACWYNTILAARSNDAGRSFTVDTPPAVVAAPPFPQSEGQGRPRGYFEPSNIVQREGHWFTLVFVTGIPGSRDGVCLLRTPDLSNPYAWRGFDGEDFRVMFHDPYGTEAGTTTSPACAHIGSFSAAVGSVSFHEPSKLYLATTVMRSGSPARATLGVTTSPDLIHWSDLAGAMDLGPAAGGGNCPETSRLMYPSLIDPASPSRNFETAGGTALLMLTRIRMQGCRDTLDRDLVAVPVRIEARPVGSGR